MVILIHINVSQMSLTIKRRGGRIGFRRIVPQSSNEIKRETPTPGTSLTPPSLILTET